MEQDLILTRVRHSWPERDGFVLERARGIPEHLFLHFSNPVDMLVENRLVEAPANTCVFFLEGTPHWFRSRGPLTHDWIHCTGDLASRLRAAGLEPRVPYHCADGPRITELIGALEAEAAGGYPHRAQMLEALFTQLLVTLSRVCHPLDTEALPKSGSASTELVLQAVREQMLSQLSHPWQITELAAMARLSPSRFYAVYKARFGLPPMEELISARIETARRRLTDTRISVRDLAENLGYQNVTHFCRQFRQRTGMTPSQYRAALNLDEA